MTAFLFFGAVLLVPRGAAQGPGPSPVVRVALNTEKKDVALEIRGSYALVDPLTSKELTRDHRLRKTHIVSGEKGIVVGDKEYPLSRLRFLPKEEVTVYMNGKLCKYRGMMDVLLTPKKEIILVNHVELEVYVQGILYHEVSARWPMEALKSQAVISRTYALYQMQVNVKRDYDVTGDIYSQVYGGQSAERYRTNLAVERSKGQVLVYKGKVIPAYFHATCGGYTEDVQELWKHIDLPPLRGVRCGFCGHSPHSWWKKNFRLKDIEEKLKANGFSVGTIKDIYIGERNESGRIKTLEIINREEKSTLISGKDFRNIIGPNIIRSNDYYVIMRGYYADFIGRGWGHGAGLCQWGAHGMASQGHKCQQILAHYYPGADLVDYRTLPAFR